MLAATTFSPTSPFEQYLRADGTLQLTGNESLVLQSGSYHIGGLELDNNSQLAIAAGANVTLWVDGAVTVVNQSVLETETGASLTVFVMGSGSVQLTNNATAIKLKLFAPSSSVLLVNNSVFDGAVVAKSLEIDNNGDFVSDSSGGVESCSPECQ